MEDGPSQSLLLADANLIQYMADIVELPHGFLDGFGMHGNVPGLFIGVDKVTDQAVTVAVEVDADELALLVDDRAATIATDGVGGADEVERGVKVKLALAVHPALREIKRRCTLVFLVAIVDTGKVS